MDDELQVENILQSYLNTKLTGYDTDKLGIKYGVHAARL